jgi:hypothetical protein
VARKGSGRDFALDVAVGALSGAVGGAVGGAFGQNGSSFVRSAVSGVASSAAGSGGSLLIAAARHEQSASTGSLLASVGYGIATSVGMALVNTAFESESQGPSTSSAQREPEDDSWKSWPHGKQNILDDPNLIAGDGWIAKVVELFENKGVKATGEVLTTGEDAIAAAKSGDELIAKDKHTAYEIAKGAGDGKEPIRHGPHGPEQMPHYHIEGQSNHIMYNIFMLLDLNNDGKVNTSDIPWILDFFGPQFIQMPMVGGDQGA